MSNTAGSSRAITTRISSDDSSPARSRWKLWRSRPAPPATIANPSPNRLVPMIEPVICACTTSGWPFARTNIASISSARLPRLTVIKPPIAGPVWWASCSVATRIQSASTPTPTMPAANTQTAGRWKT